MAMQKIWNCQTLHKSLEITNALIAVHVTSQTLYMYTEITNAVHVTSLPGSLYVCLHFANAHEEHGAVSSTGPYSQMLDCTQCNHHCQQCKSMCGTSGTMVLQHSCVAVK